MFGFRPDGRKLGKKIDPIVRFTPYIMTRHSDAQVMTTIYADAKSMSEYIHKKRDEGYKISHLSILIAAFLRTVCEFPELNRFVVGKGLYTRNELTVTFVTIKGHNRNNIEEAELKCFFDPRDTIYVVSEKLNKGIAFLRSQNNSDATVKIANALLTVPFFTAFVVDILKLMDRFGILPKAIIDASPFHSSLIITNMASIKMNSVYHHIYDFGTNSIFLGLGRRTLQMKMDSDGNLTARKVYPIGAVIDERIMGGAQYGMALQTMTNFILHPELLENPPETVLDEGVDFSLKEKYKNWNLE